MSRRPMGISPEDANYDEAHVPDHRLPDPLRFADGSPVASIQDWRELRRPELLGLFSEHVYGHTPSQGGPTTATVVSEHPDAVGGQATMVQVQLQVPGVSGAIDLLLYLPHRDQPVPVYCSLNFCGNSSVDADPRIPLTRNWVPAGYRGVVDNRATESARGCDAARWPLAMLMERGFGFATIHTSNIVPDVDDNFSRALGGLFTDRRSDRDWGTIGAWAWGLSRVLDHLLTDERVDRARIGVMGHSRLGKTALWAAAQDERFAFVASNESGCTGAALSRRRFGETVEFITGRFPHWFCRNYTRYSRREYALPVDQHELLALIAPRPLYVAAADQDLWTDPYGQFLAAQHASPVYELHGLSGLPVDDMPAVDVPVLGNISYHNRQGVHELTPFDWQQYLNQAEWATQGPRTPGLASESADVPS